MSHQETAPPPERFNFARHLLGVNADRADAEHAGNHVDRAGTCRRTRSAGILRAFKPWLNGSSTSLAGKTYRPVGAPASRRTRPTETPLASMNARTRRPRGSSGGMNL